MRRLVLVLAATAAATIASCQRPAETGGEPTMRLEGVGRPVPVSQAIPELQARLSYYAATKNAQGVRHTRGQIEYARSLQRQWEKAQEPEIHLVMQP